MTAKVFNTKRLPIVITLVAIASLMSVSVQAITWYPPYNHEWDNVPTPTDTKDARASKSSGTVSLRALSQGLWDGKTVKGAVGNTWVPSAGASSVFVSTQADWQYGLYVSGMGAYGKIEIWIELCDSAGAVLKSARVYKKEISWLGWARNKEDNQYYSTTLSYNVQAGTTYILRAKYSGYVQGGWISHYQAEWYDIWSYATCHFDYIYTPTLC